MSDPIERLNAALEGRYRIERELGAGGMATVFLAHDLKHDRKVALKVLKPELAAVVGSERFLAEIKTTANLQHPHILPLFDSGQADTYLFYVMPFVEGETLRDRLTREKQLPVDEAVRIASDVAEALQAAHDHGVIHRDIKPANILLSKGRPLVADFGIALAVSAAGGSRLTETGLSMGTPYYMSPEQASADRKPSPASDVYSLGCVLYEMLVGDPPYTGTSAQAVLAKILTEAVRAPMAVRSSVPVNVDAAIRKSLEKLPADRFASALDFRRALADGSFRHGDAATVGGNGLWSRVGPVMTGVAAIAVVLGLWGWLRPEPARSVERYEMAPPTGENGLQQLAGAFDVAPDGSWIVHAGAAGANDPTQLWTKARDQADWTPLAGTEGAMYPRISPDGSRIAYIETGNGDLRVVPQRGGQSTLAAQDGAPFAWIDDASVAMVGGERQSIYRVPVSGGAAELIWTSDSLSVRGAPSVLPDGRALLVTMCSACPVDMMLHAVDIGTGQANAVYPALYGQVEATGRLIMVELEGRVVAAPFDLDALEITGPARPILDGLATGDIFAGLVVSASGTALTVLGPTSQTDPTQTPYEPVWVDRNGDETLAVEGWRFLLAYDFGHALSPDGSRLAIGLKSDAGDDVWIKELPNGPLTRLTLDAADDARPKWSTDGRYIWYQSGQVTGVMQLYRRRADGADTPVLFPTPGRNAQEPVPTPNGELMIVRVDGGSGVGETGRDIVAYRMDGDTSEIAIAATQYDEYSPRLSADGRWLAYVSTESGRPEVYVRPVPNFNDSRVAVSNGGGIHPLWKGDGTELYYVATSDQSRVMTVASVETRPEFSVRSRQPLFELSPLLLTDAPWEPVVDVTRDGEKFLMMRRVPPQNYQEKYRLIVVENFFEELRQLMRE